MLRPLLLLAHGTAGIPALSAGADYGEIGREPLRHVRFLSTTERILVQHRSVPRTPSTRRPGRADAGGVRVAAPLESRASCGVVNPPPAYYALPDHDRSRLSAQASQARRRHLQRYLRDRIVAWSVTVIGLPSAGRRLPPEPRWFAPQPANMTRTPRVMRSAMRQKAASMSLHPTPADEASTHRLSNAYAGPLGAIGGD